MKGKRLLDLSLLLLLLSALSLVQAVEPTTIVRVIKCAENGSVLNETAVTYQWLDANLPVYGDGITHYYHQGPVFEGDKWDRNETKNLKDKGAVKGTNIADLCDLAGGMSSDDEVMIHAQDGYHIEFNYTNIYEPDPRQGPLVLTWCHSGDWSGMQLVFFADDHIFGNWDMHECLHEASQHFYELYPSTNGLSVKWVDEIRIYTGGYTGDAGGPAKSMPTPTSSPGFEIIVAIAGLLFVFYALRRRR